ncbi:FKBP-type peptidyl-prolyl cis-trans isomerase [Geobacter sp. FeAm09]|uniref:FKBP-type peptidyl-prolyl cis-trans isomerase n=1 Tax=Geobacter sp. FeAm09 TaxID=2597769 RepID=UPI0011EE3E15|nr:FKBP-type peptidyl-prolyl cis-trans isomerase [Geobacter sp. FeAm09]QEM66787.1 FKBP-type peptidyl-prolyl cis-trans isomerase [Geobacter sp. FeAm09]
MIKNIVAAFLVLLAVPVFAASEPQTEEQKTMYAIGSMLAGHISVFNFSPAELELVKQGFADAAAGKKLLVNPDDYKKQSRDLADARMKRKAGRLSAESNEFLEKAAQEKGAVKTESGMIYVATQEGSGPNPSATDKVKVNYRGTLIDGKEFDSSYKREQAAEFPLDKVIKCWTEGVQKMKTGGKAKLVCPPRLAYGESGAGAGLIPPNAVLVFEVELLEIVK